MTTKDKLQQAQQRVAEQRAQALAARPTGKPTMPRRSPPPAKPHDERPSALATAPPLLSRDGLNLYFGISYSRAHLHRLVRDGRFPPPVALGPEPYARKCWKREHIEAWIAALPTVGGEAA